MSNLPSFWKELSSAPKRKYMFQVYAGDLPPFLCHGMKKPTFNVGTAKVNFLNHEFKYPGRVTYDDIELKYYDTQGDALGGGATAKLIYRMLLNSGYVRPESALDLKTISKRKAVQPLSGGTPSSSSGGFLLVHIDEEGTPIETWKLVNAWINKVDFGDGDFSSDDATSLTLSIVYDYPDLMDVR